MRIKSIKKIGVQRTVDIEVDSDAHVYYANNIAVSNSHSTVYAQHAYCGAYAKANHPEAFFTISLRHCKHRGQKKDIEKRLLIQDARKHDLEVLPFSIKHNNKEFEFIDGSIRVGFIDMKDCGSTDWDRWQEYRKDNPVPDTWDEFLIYCSKCFNSRCMKNLIMGGGLDCYKYSRVKMVYQYQLYSRLNDRQSQWVRDNYTGSMLSTLLLMVGLGSGRDKPCYNKPSLTKLDALLKDWENEAYSTWTNAERIELSEADIIGAPLTCSRLEDSDMDFASNITCLDLANIKDTYQEFKVLCWITRVHKIKTKNKDDMAFISFSDGMYEIDDGIIFPEAFVKYHYNLIEDMEVLLSVKKSNRGGFIINKVIEI